MEIFLAVKSMTPFGGDTMVSLKICPSFGQILFRELGYFVIL